MNTYLLLFCLRRGKRPAERHLRVEFPAFVVRFRDHIRGKFEHIALASDLPANNSVVCLECAGCTLVYTEDADRL